MTRFGGRSSDIKLVTEYLSTTIFFLLQVSYPNEFYLNVGVPAVREKMSSYPGEITRLLSRCPGSRSIIQRLQRSSRIRL